MKQRLSNSLFLIAIMAMFTIVVKAQPQASATPQPPAPELEYVMQLKVTLGETYSTGPTQHGDRVVIPITGGTFEGPQLKGTIINGGADYQLGNQQLGRTEIEAIYSIKTDDGVYIHVRNRGIIRMGNGDDGKPSFYFRAAPQFETDVNSKYAWLNNSLFLCAPGFDPQFKGIVLHVWRVK